MTVFSAFVFFFFCFSMIVEIGKISSGIQYQGMSWNMEEINMLGGVSVDVVETEVVGQLE